MPPRMNEYDNRVRDAWVLICFFFIDLDAKENKLKCKEDNPSQEKQSEHNNILDALCYEDNELVELLKHSAEEKCLDKHLGSDDEH